MNRPARTIVRDDLIVEIARRNPTRERDLLVVRGLAKRDLDAIVRTAVEARGLPAEALPAPAERDQDPPQVALVTGILNAVLGDLCARRHLAANLVASTADVKLLVRARLNGDPLPESSGLTHGWRAGHLLPDLLAVLEGRCAVRVKNVRADAPLAYDDPAATDGEVTPSAPPSRP
jgi:ribonuclease D